VSGLVTGGLEMYGDAWTPGWKEELEALHLKRACRPRV